ncbi:MAG TPA: hypothetical protein VH088_00180 [Terriglobales bacterium]|jgi:hypothetical protein|nr:hypothetical protein [Terriglobales bacterium]
MVQCPRCKDHDVHDSLWMSRRERWSSIVLLRKPARCYACMHRFHTWIFSALKPRGNRYARKRKSNVA